jgi:clan AA aspartic protease (TIGR02281 family)
MSKLSWCFLVLLSISLGLNVIQYQNGSGIPVTNKIEQPVQAPVSKFENSSNQLKQSKIDEQLLLSMEDISANISYKQDWIEQCQKWISVGEWSKATDFIQRYLQQNPRDIEFLLLEALLIEKTNHISYALAHYYSVLDLPLTEEQQILVMSKIDSLVAENVDKLKQIRSWDILATFLEPLWQFDPTNRNYILDLSEAYAQQQLSSLMEYVLASILPEDPEAIRIRRLISSLELADNNGSEDQLPPETFDRAVALEKIGDHFIVEAKTMNAQVKLMLDTGATTTVISEKAFNRISTDTLSDFVGEYIVNTAGGQVQAPIYRFRELSIADYSVDNIAVVVLPLEEFSDADGLLGMNFLKEFVFRIDQQRSLLYLDN